MENDHKNSNPHPKTNDKGWFERNVNLIIAGLVLACAATLIAQAMFRLELFGLHRMFSEEHPAHFSLESMFGFQAMFGFVAFVAVVYLGKFLRIFVKRDEDYYDS